MAGDWPYNQGSYDVEDGSRLLDEVVHQLMDLLVRVPCIKFHVVKLRSEETLQYDLSPNGATQF